MAGLSVLGFCAIGCLGYREGARKWEDRPIPGSSWALRRRGTECEAAGVQRSMRASVQGRRVKDERWGDIAVRYRWQGCRGRRIRDAVL